MKRLFCFLILATFTGSLFGCTQAPTPSSISCSGPALTHGEITENPNEVIKSMLPLANYLAARLADYDYACGNVKMVLTVDEMIKSMNNHEVDIFMDSMFPAYLVSASTGAQPILRRWRNCDDEYYSVLFTLEGSEVTSLDDLRGGVIAMDRSYSTSGFVLPAVYLIDLGYKLVVKDSYTESIAGDEIGIFFSLDDINTLNLVREGKVLAGATDDYNFGRWSEQAQAASPTFRLIKLAETGAIPRQVVLVRPGLESGLQEKIKYELSNAHLSPEGLSILEQAAKTCKFDDAPGGIQAAFDQMQQMYNKIEAIEGWQAAYEKGY